MIVPLTFFTGRSLLPSRRMGLALSATFQSNLPSFASPAGKIRFCTVMGLSTASAGTFVSCIAGDGGELRADEILPEIEQLHLRQLLARQCELEDRHTRGVVTEHIRRR